VKPVTGLQRDGAPGVIRPGRVPPARAAAPDLEGCAGGAPPLVALLLDLGDKGAPRPRPEA